MISDNVRECIVFNEFDNLADLLLQFRNEPVTKRQIQGLGCMDRSSYEDAIAVKERILKQTELYLDRAVKMTNQDKEALLKDLEIFCNQYKLINRVGK